MVYVTYGADVDLGLTGYSYTLVLRFLRHSQFALKFTVLIVMVQIKLSASVKGIKPYKQIKRERDL